MVVREKVEGRSVEEDVAWMCNSTVNLVSSVIVGMARAIAQAALRSGQYRGEFSSFASAIFEVERKKLLSCSFPYYRHINSLLGDGFAPRQEQQASKIKGKAEDGIRHGKSYEEAEERDHVKRPHAHEHDLLYLDLWSLPHKHKIKARFIIYSTSKTSSITEVRVLLSDASAASEVCRIIGVSCVCALLIFFGRPATPETSMGAPTLIPTLSICPEESSAMTYFVLIARARRRTKK
jgi:hypothetical protein